MAVRLIFTPMLAKKTGVKKKYLEMGSQALGWHGRPGGSGVMMTPAVKGADDVGHAEEMFGAVSHEQADA
jgi:hypothetical protein